MRQVLPQEFVAKERLAIVQEALEGLQAIQASRRLNFTEMAALHALQRLYSRSHAHVNSTINDKAMNRPVAIAYKAMEGSPSCVRW